MTLSIMGLFETLSIIDTRHNSIMLNVLFNLLSIIMLSVTMLNVVMLNVVAPINLIKLGFITWPAEAA